MLDVLVAGGGPVGAALALSLADSGLDVQVIDSAARKDEILRPVALSHASRLILERVDAFDERAGTPIHSVHVSQSGRFGRTVIRREELGVEALGYVHNLGPFAATLSEKLGAFRREGRVKDWADTGDTGDTADAIAVRIETDSGVDEMAARLLVVADGGQTTGDDLALRDYGQSAIVATIASSEPPRGRAWERFTSEGPLALLPYQDRYALVWTTSSARARELAAADDDAFLAALQTTFGMRLGHFTAAGRRLSFPLHLRYKNDPVLGPRCLIAGNAAQSLHPVAGQGLNLGLRDAFELAQLLRETPREKIGGGEFLERYRRRRNRDRRATILATDSLIHLFGLDDPIIGHLRGAALTALDLLPPLRRSFARRMVFGLRNLP